MVAKRCKKGTHKSKTGKSCVANEPKRKPKRYRLNFELIYGKPKKKAKVFK